MGSNVYHLDPELLSQPELLQASMRGVAQMSAAAVEPKAKPHPVAGELPPSLTLQPVSHFCLVGSGRTSASTHLGDVEETCALFLLHLLQQGCTCVCTLDGHRGWAALEEAALACGIAGLVTSGPPSTKVPLLYPPELTHELPPTKLRVATATASSTLSRISLASFFGGGSGTSSSASAEAARGLSKSPPKHRQHTQQSVSSSVLAKTLRGRAAAARRAIERQLFVGSSANGDSAAEKFDPHTLMPHTPSADGERNDVDDDDEREHGGEGAGAPDRVDHMNDDEQDLQWTRFPVDSSPETYMDLTVWQPGGAMASKNLLVYTARWEGAPCYLLVSPIYLLRMEPSIQNPGFGRIVHRQMMTGVRRIKHDENVLSVICVVGGGISLQSRLEFAMESTAEAKAVVRFWKRCARHFSG